MSFTNSEDYVEQVEAIVAALNDMLLTRPHEWEDYLPSARSAIAALDKLHFFRDTARFEQQAWFLYGLQDYAFHDADNGYIRDIADWCQAEWLRLLLQHPENPACLEGLGRNWLQRAQYSLAKIQIEEAADSSSEGSNQASMADKVRKEGLYYVEAQGFLQPAVDFFQRAVRAADGLGKTSGDLLAKTAESQMSLGNITKSPNDKELFTQAIYHLRRAAAIPDYTLCVYLQQYLDDYGRYV